MEWTTCKTCHRVVWATDVDEAGDCLLCAPRPVQATPDAPAASPESVVTKDIPATPSPGWKG